MLEGSPIILVVEDDLSLREIYSKLLGHNGFEVIDVPDAASALQVMQRHETRPHLILLDYLLPDNMNADMFVKNLSSQPSQEKIPIILVSALGTETKEIAALKSHPWVLAAFNKGDITHQKIVDFVRAYFGA